MKIKDVTCSIVEAPMQNTWRGGNFLFDKGRAAIVQVFTDEGINGIGEAIVRLGGGPVKSIVEEILKPCIVGKDPMNIEGLWKKMFYCMGLRGHSRGYFLEAMSGVDIALWDVAGKTLEVPLYRLMMGCGREEIPVYASSIFFNTPEKMAEEACALKEKGYRSMKIKIGQGLEKDTECLEAIRKSVGPGIKLMVDANGVYNRTDAIYVGKMLEDLDVAWFEEPLRADDLDGYKLLSEKLDLPLAAGEAEFTVWGIRPIIENGVRIIQPNVSRAGGITESRRIASFAGALHLPYAPHTGVSSGVCMAASLHLAASAENFMIYEHMVENNPLAYSLFTTPFAHMKEGKIPVPNGPGLGITMNMDAFEKFRVN